MMTVGDLKEMLEGVDNEMEVIIPMNAEFDGIFRSPCAGETGVIEITAEDIEDDDIDEFTQMKEVFAILPHGFGEPHEGVDPELN